MEIGNVLSLFDGMSCGQIALNRLGIKYNKYYASEIDKFSIRVAQRNYPYTVQIGDVCKVNGGDLPEIDLLIGGSPCQGFSSSGNRLNFDDPRSKLFFEFVRILKECKPKYWFLENVRMKKEWQDVITEYLGVEPVLINSALVSAQNRNRVYWANFSISQPEDKGIKLVDILDDKAGAIRGRMINKAVILGRKLDANKGMRQCLEVKKNGIDKSNCLTTVEKDNVLTCLPPGRYVDAFENKLPFRYYTLKECCRLQTVPEDYFRGIVSDSRAKKMLGNGWTIDVIVHIIKCMISEKLV